MRLLHHKLIPVLPRQFLLQQHRSCAALRGNGWGRKNRLVNYVFRHSWEHLYYYHQLVIQEMVARGYHPNQKWLDFFYRGKKALPLSMQWYGKLNAEKLFPEHTPLLLFTDCFMIKGKINKNEKQYNMNEVYRFIDFCNSRKGSK